MQKRSSVNRHVIRGSQKVIDIEFTKSEF